jgi:RHS repeat-associated protein
VSRTLRSASTRTLTRALRGARRRGTTLTARLRLDTLEAREQPGSVLGATAAGQLVDPLAAMTLAVGDTALLAPAAAPPTATGGPAEGGAGGSTFATSPSVATTQPGGSPEWSAPAEEPDVPVGVALAPTALGPADLSITDPDLFPLPPVPPASTEGAGGTGGGSAEPVPSSFAGQSTADGPVSVPGPGANGGGSGASLVDGPAPRSAPTVAAAGPANGSSAPDTGSGRPAETFVTPPQDAPALEGPAPTAARVSAAATTTNPIFAVGTDSGVAGQVKVYDATTQALKATLSPYANTFKGGVRVAVADVSGDGVGDVVTAQGGGGSNQVKVYDGATFKALKGTLGGFSPFTTAEAAGVWVAAGDVTGDGKADIVVGTDGNTNPQVKIYSGTNGSLVRSVDVSKLGLVGGVRVAAGDVNADGKADVIVGARNGASHVAAFDGGNGKPLYDYLPGGAGDRVGVSVAAGDTDGDGAADVVTGTAGPTGQVSVFGGGDTTSAWNLDALAGFAGGVRVGTVDADGDGREDVLAAAGPGAGEVRAYAAARGGQLFTLQPFGASYTGGLFVAGDARPVPQGGGGVGILSAQTVSIRPDYDGIEGGSAQFVVTRTGDTSQSLTITLSWGGTATASQDYPVPTSSITFQPGQSSYNVPVGLSGTPYQDSLVEGDETVVVTLSYTNPPPPSPPIVVFDQKQAAITIHDDDGPPDEPTAGAAGGGGSPGVSLSGGPLGGSCNGDPGFAVVGNGSGENIDPGFEAIDHAGTDANIDPGFTSLGCVGWSDGDVCVTGTCTPGAGGFGQPWGVGWGWTNLGGAAAPGYAGNGIVPKGVPALRTDGTHLVVLRGGSAAEYFDGTTGTITPRHMSQSTMTYNSGTGEYTLTSSGGARLVFNDFSASLPTYQKGQIKSVTDPNGNVTSISSRTTDGKPADIQRTSTAGGVTTTESYQYAYIASGTNAGKIDTITLRRQVGTGGSWTTVRTVTFTYHDGTGSGGTAGDLHTAVEKDAAGNVITNWWYRYYTTSSATGYAGAMKYVVSGAAYDRLKAWCDANATTPDAATDAQVSPFADHYYEYDSVHRVTKHTQQGTGCTACFGGLQTNTYTYTTSPFAPGYSSWRTKTVETHPDNNTLTVYTNFAGQPVLKVYKDTTTGQEWCTYFQRDTQGRLTLMALPSAVSGYDETKADLLNNQSGNYQYLRDSQGLIQKATYYGSNPSPAAGPTTAGGVTGYVYQTSEQRGEGGTAVLQRTTQYYSRTDTSITVYPVANVTRYRNTDGTGGQTTSFGYTFFTGTIQPQQITTTLPAVTTTENGSGTADSTVAVEDDRGRVIWQKDQAGFLTYTAYDDVTGGVTKMIQDVDTTQTSTFANLPSGWTTPTGGGLHLTTAYELDDQGRPTKATSPSGNITYTVYNDAAHEVRVYPGWDATNNVPTGPTQVYREDRAHGYVETLTMSATPTVSGGRPTGTEAISGVQSLSRSVLNDAGQVVYQDQYFDLTGVTYSQSSVTLGTAGTNYLRTQFFYGKLGQLEKTVSPSGTIYRTWFDGQARPLSTWVGTDDTPTTGFFSPTNLAGTDMVQQTATEYDAGGVGDGLVTKTTQIPGSPDANRDTAYSYDWRDRLVAAKAGVQGTESTSVNRPILYVEYDNLGQAIVSEQYDGDGLSITTDANSDGVPDRPSSGALRAKSTADFDELGRDYQDKTFSVDPSTGSVSTNALVSKRWFNSRGLVMKSSAPGGLVTKDEFDGAGRTTKEYQTDGGGDAAYADAGTVTGDAVLSQTELAYDSDGNTILTTTRDRFHDETGTGALGTPTTGVHARVSYRAAYFDLADRSTADVDVGTNGGTAYTRPAGVPSRSDTTLVTTYGYNSAGLPSDVTDPRGLLTKTYFDLLGRTTKTIENYVDGVVSDTDDKTTELTYDLSGNRATLRADLTGGGYEETKWVYGVTSPIVSNDVLKEVRYPDPTTGAASSTLKDAYTVNQLGEVLTLTDRNGNVHTYSLDVLGRKTADNVTTLGSGVDGTVREIDTAYDGQGNAYLVTSKDGAGAAVNQVQRAYNGLGQLTQEWQATTGAVNTGTTPSVQYGYSFAPSGTTNHSRLTSLTYPNGRVLTYNYATGLADSISRLSSITDGATTLESYDYLGLTTVVRRAHPQPGVDLTYIKLTGESDGSAGDKYIGLDRFGRVADQRWTTSAGTAADRWQYGYDRDSNRTYKENLVDSTRSELYAYDGLNQLASFARGTLNGTKDAIVGTPSRSQSWDFDALGNFDGQTTDGTAQTRTHNKQNEITSVSGATTPTYDANGNLTTDETGKTFKYDAWNRLVEVRDSGNTLLATYRYDGLNRRVRETRGATTTDLYYSSDWQVLEERVSGVVNCSYVWSPVYVDALIARDRDTNGDGTLDERLYAAQDANWNVTALLDTSGNVVERYAYDSFGGFAVLTPTWGARASSLYAWKYQHQGARWDPDSRAYSFRNREFHPSLGRWLQTDPSQFNGANANLYAAFQNNPVAFTDPLGLQPVIVIPRPQSPEPPLAPVPERCPATLVGLCGTPGGPLLVDWLLAIDCDKIKATVKKLVEEMGKGKIPRGRPPKEKDRTFRPAYPERVRARRRLADFLALVEQLSKCNPGAKKDNDLMCCALRALSDEYDASKDLDVLENIENIVAQYNTTHYFTRCFGGVPFLPPTMFKR